MIRTLLASVYANKELIGILRCIHITQHLSECPPGQKLQTLEAPTPLPPGPWHSDIVGTCPRKHLNFSDTCAYIYIYYALARPLMDDAWSWGDMRIAIVRSSCDQGWVSMQAACPPYYSVNKDNPTQMYPNAEWIWQVGFVCAISYSHLLKFSHSPTNLLLQWKPFAKTILQSSDDRNL